MKASRKANSDGSRREAPRYQDSRTWQRADKGYNRSYGELERYRQQFRVGFSRGLSGGLRTLRVTANGHYGRAVPRQDTYGYPGGYGTSYPGGYGNTYPTRSQGPYYGGQAATPTARRIRTALNDGIEKGREDARKRRSFDPLRHDWYRDGTRHYKSEYGPKQQYANVYRDGVPRRLRARLSRARLRSLSAASAIDLRGHAVRHGPLRIHPMPEEPAHPPEQRGGRLPARPPAWRCRAPCPARCAALTARHGDLLDGLRIGRAEPAEDVRVELEDGRVADAPAPWRCAASPDSSDISPK